MAPLLGSGIFSVTNKGFIGGAQAIALFEIGISITVQIGIDGLQGPYGSRLLDRMVVLDKVLTSFVAKSVQGRWATRQHGELLSIYGHR